MYRIVQKAPGEAPVDVEASNIWFISDNHFSHYNIIDYEDRPFKESQIPELKEKIKLNPEDEILKQQLKEAKTASIHDMNKFMTEKWNESIQPNDIVYFLGDFCLSGTNNATNILSKLNGYKIAIKGNHDGSRNKLKKIGFDEVYLDLVLDIAPGIDVKLNHYPYGPDEKEVQKMIEQGLPSWKIQHFKSRPVDNGGWLIHGHVHGNWRIKGKMINVSVENWDYRPVHLRQILNIINNSFYF